MKLLKEKLFVKFSSFAHAPIHSFCTDVVDRESIKRWKVQFIYSHEDWIDMSVAFRKYEVRDKIYKISVQTEGIKERNELAS